MARIAADTDELRAFTNRHLAWDDDLASLLAGSGALVGELLATPALGGAAHDVREVLGRLVRAQRRCREADGEPRDRAVRFDRAEAAGGGTARRSLRAYGARTVRAAFAGGNADSRRYAIRDAQSCIAQLRRALATGYPVDLEDAIRRIWRRYGVKGSRRYQLLFAQALLRWLPPAAIWQITRTLDIHGISLARKSDEMVAWARLFGRASRAPGGIGAPIRNLLTRRLPNGRFAFADEVATLCAIDPHGVSGPWRGLAAAMILGSRGMRLGASEGIAAMLLRSTSAQRWFWRWGERFGTLTAANVDSNHVRFVIARQLVRHQRSVLAALAGRGPAAAADARRYRGLIAEIVAMGGKGRTVLLELGARQVASLTASLRRAPGGILDLLRWASSGPPSSRGSSGTTTAPTCSGRRSPRWARACGSSAPCP